MTNREHFIVTLQACYFGDRNAFEEIIRMYDEKENIIKEVREYIKQFVDVQKNFYPFVDLRCVDLDKILKILDKGNSSNE